MTEETTASGIPNPCGYNILCAVPDIPDRYGESGIVKAEKTIHTEMLMATVLYVVRMGPDCYKDEAKFSSPWCKTGDFIVVRPNTGTRIKVFDKEFRLITDDQVEAVVDDPRGISRV